MEFLENISLLNNESISYNVRRPSTKIPDYSDMSIDAASPDSGRVPSKRPNKAHVPSACVSHILNHGLRTFDKSNGSFLDCIDQL